MDARSGLVFLPVVDLDATHRFYADILGLTLALDQGACRIYRVAEGCYWGFCHASEPHADPSKTILTLESSNVEAWHAKLTSAGVETDGPPRENPRFKIFHFFATDPNGYRLEVQRFLDPNWPNSE